MEEEADGEAVVVEEVEEAEEEDERVGEVAVEESRKREFGGFKKWSEAQESKSASSDKAE